MLKLFIVCCLWCTLLNRSLSDICVIYSWQIWFINSHPHITGRRIYLHVIVGQYTKYDSMLRLILTLYIFGMFLVYDTKFLETRTTNTWRITSRLQCCTFVFRRLPGSHMVAWGVVCNRPCFVEWINQNWLQRGLDNCAGPPDKHKPAHVTIMVADVLAPNRHQTSSSNHGDSTVTIMSHESHYLT